MIERTANMKITRTSKTFYYVKRTYSLFEHQASSAHLHEIFVNYTGLSENWKPQCRWLMLFQTWSTVYFCQ